MGAKLPAGDMPAVHGGVLDFDVLAGRRSVGFGDG